MSELFLTNFILNRFRLLLLDSGVFEKFDILKKVSVTIFNINLAARIPINSLIKFIFIIIIGIDHRCSFIKFDTIFK